MKPLMLYRPLDARRRGIRLLRLDFSVSDRISCTLEHTDLESYQGSYDALSYAWGHAHELHPIWIDEHQIQVRSNLYCFLHTLRDQKWRRWPVWIDQLCIDQGNVQEKESQIGLMREIYEKAHETLIWLGPDPDQGAAFSCLRRVMSDCDVQTERHMWSNSVSCAERQSVANLLSLPYWRRHWIVQEVCLSRRRTILYGSGELPWRLFFDFVYSVHRQSTYSRDRRTV